MYLADGGTCSDGVGEMSRMATSAPAATSWWAVLRPMPLLPPVRMATWMYTNQHAVFLHYYDTRVPAISSYLAFELLRHADCLSVNTRLDSLPTESVTEQ